MEIEYKGANCLTLSYKKETLVVDPSRAHCDLQPYKGNFAAQLITDGSKPVESGLVIEGPGEYEVLNCSIKGVAAQSHRAEEGDRSATMYRLDLEDVSVAVLGHVAPKLSEEQMEQLGLVDILILPVGGHGYTLDAKSAADLVRKIEPKIVIPTHFNDEGVAYEVPQDSLNEFIKEIGSPVEQQSKLKVKTGTLPAALTVYHLTRTK